jgi:predicted transcriptional regulator
VRRNKLEIIACILNICKSPGASKTRIVYQANLNFKNAAIYLEWLISHGYLAVEGKVYRITPAGQALLSSLADINSMINVDLNRES